jgi:hypothetical protein
MNTDDATKIVQGLKVGLIGHRELQAIKALLESIEHYREVIVNLTSGGIECESAKE